MVSSTFIAALSALPLAFAQYSYYGGNATVSLAPNPTGTGSPSVQTVSVGKDGFVFTPDTIHAKVGEEITFQFFPKNHSVVQADFNNPCNPSEGAIFSGFIPAASGPANQTFTIKVHDDKPIWLYCAALLPRPHCAAGMVAVINPPGHGPNTLAAFRELAAKTNISTAPSAVNGGSVHSGAPTPSGTATGGPVLSTGAASSLLASGGAIGGLMGAFAALLL
ncbi:Cupredoxin [Zopfia rhizophila CBS 207.26]|uniref:Cupredoxin n=1 Tax=Zopfia rhizophila CBS 207.26 TaxID=1314779 RepID=A0A6A6EAQ3_9PEZI|nr:Cupredoxin [Zopfia rhizophila CBS 207.26]